MPVEPRPYQQAKLLNRYYEKVGKAAAGQGQCPRFVEFRAGFGLVDEIGSRQSPSADHPSQYDGSPTRVLPGPL